MPQTLAHIALIVRDYDEAIAYYTGVLGFRLIEDTDMGAGKRWVLVAPPGSTGTNLLLARAATPEQSSRVGNQTGGRVFLFLHTDNFQRDYRALQAHHVEFVREPKDEPYGTVAVFKDVYGNLWDLIQPR
jgi:catechol 2,3-dioxygenase-like lactoylglutathione lyase family enzyme